MNKKRILTGDRPTGRLHIGHYVGSLRRRVELQNSGEYDKIFIMIADAQALTDNFDNPEKIRQNIIEVALDYLSAGLDPAKSTLFVQSQIPELTELTFFYSNLVTVSRLQRNPTVKNEIKLRNFEASIPVGFFNYPISQAADITAFKATTVPVGEDQLPMIEQTREIVRKFNSIYGVTLTEPEHMLSPTPRIKGLDGKEKMGKSLGNALYLKDSPEVVKEKIMKAVTDPEKIKKDDKANPDVCMVYYYHKLINNPNLETVCKECKNGTRGCVACKKELIENIEEFLAPIRKKRKYYEENPEIVKEILDNGTKEAKIRADATMKKVKASMMIDY